MLKFMNLTKTSFHLLFRPNLCSFHLENFSTRRKVLNNQKFLNILTAENENLKTVRKSQEKGPIEEEESNAGSQFWNDELFGGTSSNLESRISQPRSVLNNLISEVNREAKNIDHKVVFSFSSVKQNKLLKGWTCNCVITWPHSSTFSVTAKTKQVAANHVSYKVLNWLYSQGKINNQGKPIIYDREQVQSLTCNDIKLLINENDIKNVDKIISYYKEHVEPLRLVSVNEDHTNVSDEKMTDEKNENCCNEVDKRKRNEYLIRRKSRNFSSGNVKSTQISLPIYNFRDKILQTIQDNQVVLINGEPGCGKSTQVPQYIFDQHTELSQGSDCNILISQPRRISAISLAERVAYEREEETGDVVGYQVRFRTKPTRPPGGSIMFCTTGIVLRQLQTNPHLHGVSHVLLDEAHERDVNTDMLMLLLKRAVNSNKQLKLIVMSATLNSQLIEKYFDNSAVLHIPGFTYPVKSFFIDDISRFVSMPQTKQYLSNPESSPRIYHEEIARVIEWIDKNKKDGSILCFLPGWSDIVSVKRQLEHLGYPNNTCVVLPLHSRIDYSEQEKIFHTLPPGVKKIILSTNVAETSVTINDVMYVVECGVHKEERLIIHRNISSLDNQWISQANVRQRKGRAGRVRPGECFHLYTQDKLNNMDRFPIPELLRIPLEKTVLDVKSYNENERAVDFLSQMPETVSYQAVGQAVNDLIKLGILDQDEKLTSLGQRVVRLTTHPKLSKALVNACVFRCLDKMLTISATLSADVEFFQRGLESKAAAGDIKRKYNANSDHLAMCELYNEWNRAHKTENGDTFVMDNSIRSDSFYLLKRLRRLYIDQLAECDMIGNSYRESNTDMNVNTDELVTALLYSGVDCYLYHRPWDMQKGRLKMSSGVIITESGAKSTISSQSVNHKKTNFKSPFLTCFKLQQSAERRTTIVRETSVLSPLALYLFTNEQVHVRYLNSNVGENNNDESAVAFTIGNKPKFKLLLSKEHAVSLCHLRNIVTTTLNYFIEQGIKEDDKLFMRMCKLRDDLIFVLTQLFYNTSITK